MQTHAHYLILLQNNAINTFRYSLPQAQDRVTGDRYTSSGDVGGLTALTFLKASSQYAARPCGTGTVRCVGMR